MNDGKTWHCRRLRKMCPGNGRLPNRRHDAATIPKPQKTSKTADKVNRRLKWRRIVFESEEIGEQNDYQAL